MLTNLQYQLAVALPNISAGGGGNNPIEKVLIKIADAVMAILAVVLFVCVFIGIAKMVLGLLGRREGGIGGGVALFLAAIVGLGLLYAGGTFVNSWQSFLGL